MAVYYAPFQVRFRGMLQTTLTQRPDINDVEWDSFVRSSPQNTMYFYTWYLDALCEDWCAIIVRKREKWVAVFPIHPVRKLGITYAVNPYLAQFQGVVHAPDLAGGGRPYEGIKEVLTAIAEAIPKGIKLFHSSFHPSVDYLLPFQWAGYQVTPKYTYWLTLPKSQTALWSGFSKSVKRDIRQAERVGLRCVPSDSEQTLVTFLRDREFITAREQVNLERLWKSVREKGKGFILHVLDQDEQVRCAAAFLIDHDRLIYFLCASCKEAKFSGNSFLIHEAMQRCYSLPGVKYFDFEGSMIPSVEHYFRGFGPEKVLYFQAFRDDLPALHRWGYQSKKRLKQVKMSLR